MEALSWFVLHARDACRLGSTDQAPIGTFDGSMRSYGLCGAAEPSHGVVRVR